MTAEPESFLNARAAEGMALLLGTCGVGGFSEVLDPQSCLTQGPALSPGCPNTCIPPAGVRARSQMVWESGNMRTDASRAICIHAAFPGLIRSCESSSLCGPDGAWPVPPLKGTAVTDQIVPYCQQLSGFQGSAFCFGITSVPILLKEGGAQFLFFFFFLTALSVFLAVYPHGGEVFLFCKNPSSPKLQSSV